MADTIEPDLPASPPEEVGAAAGWFSRTVRRLFPPDLPREASAPGEQDDNDRDPPDLPPTWYLT